MTLRDKAGRFGKSLKRRVVEFSQRAFLAFVFIGMTTAMFQIFVFKSAPEVKVITKEVQAAAEKKEIPAVLQRIAKCESKTSQKGKNGQLNYNVNTNRTIDIGKYQINAVHFEEATKLGYNLLTEEGNEAFALYLYETKGTEPWYSTKSCWNR